MQPEHHVYLPSFPLLVTSDLDEARHEVTQKFCDHRLQLDRGTKGLSVRHNHVAGQNISLNYLHYGADVHIDPGMLGDFYLLQIPLSGSAFIRHRGAEVVATARAATLLNPDRETDMQWRGDCRKLLLQIDKTHLQNVAETLIGAPLPGPVRFDPKVDMTHADGKRLRQLVVACVRAAEEEALFDGALNAGAALVEYDLANALLTLQPSNISHIIERADQQALPRQIKAALGYMHANLTEPISLADIARQAQTNVRTLQKGFKRAFGCSPMQVLRNIRLDAAHYMLTARQAPPSVTEAAYCSGFSHLGRFSKDYKARFGHLPSENGCGL